MYFIKATISKLILFQHVINVRYLVKYFTSFHAKPSKSIVYFTLVAHLTVDQPCVMCLTAMSGADLQCQSDLGIPLLATLQCPPAAFGP